MDFFTKSSVFWSLYTNIAALIGPRCGQVTNLSFMQDALIATSLSGHSLALKNRAMQHKAHAKQ
jgi:hypothetical protein